MSKLREAFVADPPSTEIAIDLNAKDAVVCEHHRDPCYLRCGVRLLSGTLVGIMGNRLWEPIPIWEREAWLARVEGAAANDR